MKEKVNANLNFLAQFVKSPLPLTPDNFTPVTRTPWGGSYITEHLKNSVCPDKIGQRVGESWDISCEPSFPSKILGSSILLTDLIAKHPHELLSEAYVKAHDHPTCEILVKIIDAAEDLSLQVHPSDDDPSLKADECGKFESWFVLHAEAGAGIYLGFSKPITKDQLANALKEGRDLRPLLKFVPVKAGDFFEIPVGTCHSLGKGVVVLEPQHTISGKKGKTYRIYDWGRKYNAKGELDPAGKPRELHIEQALRIVQPEQQCGKAFLESSRGSVKVQTLGEGLKVESFGGNAFFKCHRISLQKQKVLTMNVESGFGALIPLEGYFALRAFGGIDTYWQKGQPGFLPSASFPLRIEALADSLLFIITPNSARESWHRMEA